MDFNKTAKKNPKLHALYQDINAWKPIVSEISAGVGSAWGSYINASNQAVVCYTKTKNKESALAHELLHFSIQKSGYKRMCCSITTLNPTSMKQLIDCLDNELQHHRMFSQYCELGYQREKFYHDEDHQTASFIEKFLNNYNNNQLELIINYMTLIAPGGSLTNRQKAAFSSRFRALASAPEFFDVIDEAIKKWTNMECLNQSSTVYSIISAIPGDHSTWIGFDNGTGFPESGFFVGKALTQDEFIQHKK